MIDLRKKFDMESREWDKDTRIIVCDVGGHQIGMIVDAVEEVRRIPGSTIEPTPAIASTVNAEYIKGVVKLESQLLIFLDVSRIASEVNREVAEMKISAN